ncbi:hypothetical protein [Amycolatopsis sp. cmx-4-83]|uniref:hypothetical protein n=1 Tax=Amycolatopsis sp. cmx-4-83 TaxID=2790940 RepID=UPI00397D450E
MDVTSLFALPLVVPRENRYAQLGLAPEATAAEIRAATDRYVARLKAAGASDEEIAQAHGLSLEKAEDRAAYDAEHPPLSLLRLEPAGDPVFDDRATSLAALRRELERFLLDAGEAVHHPDDTTRTDFTADFSPTPLLDHQQPGRTDG